MSISEELRTKVCALIDERQEHIIGLGEAIMDAPELGFKEVRTADRVKKVFEEVDLPFESELALTGVKAVLRGKKPGPTVALMGELDALVVPDHPRADPNTGAAHACGHNAQIAGLMGATIGLTGADISEHLSGNIVFFAVPAEEYVEISYRAGLVKEGKTSFLSGKAELISCGAFDDVDIAIMIHSSSPDALEGQTGVQSSSNGFLAKNITFIGQAAHAAVGPHEGINALSAAQLALSAIDAQRPTFRDEDHVRIHPIITKGGDLVNIIPREVKMETYVRGRTPEAILDAAAKVDRALRGAAMAIGARVEIETVPGNLPLRPNSELAEIFEKNATHLFGPGTFRNHPHGAGSTDAGDLSQIIPLLHPYMTGARGIPHAPNWHIADHDSGYIAPAKTLAMMAIDLLTEDAAKARAVIEVNPPAMTKDAYLQQQHAVFSAEVFDGAV